ncbi:hypothetical protein PVAND_006240 [Polypedilum vanderplanki]|uniref:Uncharacterized protein n=1 Tax=Polypedilum vanderplanki TaxID=319348 RepID=A0A9J6C2L0_POLVA|nr:hypothetical protein PVAND_006240 [Polypedilum vanderplanki]
MNLITRQKVTLFKSLNFGYDQLIIENHATSMVNLNNVTILKYVWKIIQNNHNPYKSIAFVSRNFPFPTTYGDLGDLCNDRIGLKGGLRCCNVNTLINAIGYVPKNFFQ